ncbi:hypothetical protein [Asticcacaulis sp. 201]|uniref:hypothetical protein n=1 Tax=Asticcacaulis sp. 201 TaxID=3028787 RepID=UPI00291704D9|nr:hypothetical protein [Asticcacaulis sp. 201]MDV6332787.1 hypothetical protein [Asticcacaulis sp. 201]
MIKTTSLLVGLLAVSAVPAFAADPVVPYQSIAPLSLKAEAGKQNTAQSDPLTDVTQMDLALKFTCAAANCDQAAFQLLLEGEGNDVAQIGFTAQDGLLKGAVSKNTGDVAGKAEAFQLAPSPGEAFDVRVHWTSGNRVSFDLYRKDATGREVMESHDVQLSARVHHLFLRVSSGDLVLLKQTYKFRH